MTSLLVIDGDEMVRATLALLLEGAGYEVAQASCAEDGARAYRRHPADAVLCEIHLPGRGGLCLIRQLLHESPGVRIVAMGSGGWGGDSLGAARRLGAAGTLAKPFGRVELLAAVEGALLRQAA